MMASLSGGLATMGSGVPYALGAKFAHPDRHVIALVGDGAMQMNGINGLITLARVWHEWGNPRLTVMVLNNGDLNQVTWEQRAFTGDPRYLPSQALPDFPYARYAELVGLGGVRVEHPEQVGPAWEQALAADVPTVIEMVTDPNVPPLPPHVSAKQAWAYARAMMRGDPDATAVITASIKEVWDGLFPSRS
jgi:pyruvate dehydrogenase (quinone)